MYKCVVLCCGVMALGSRLIESILLPALLHVIDMIIPCHVISEGYPYFFVSCYPLKSGVSNSQIIVLNL